MSKTRQVSPSKLKLLIVWQPFFKSLFFSLLSIVIASYYFADLYKLAASALITIALNRDLLSYLEDNRRTIWDEKGSPATANTELAFRIIAVFIGIFTAAFVMSTAAAPAEAVSGAYLNTLPLLLKHNFSVLTGAVVFALFYRTGGLTLILAWNAIHWGQAYLSHIEAMFRSHAVPAAFLYSAALIPHLICEVSGYILAGMSGVFFSKAAFKYRLGSDKLFRVSKACFFLFAASILLISLAAVLEVMIPAAPVNI